MKIAPSTYGIIMGQVLGLIMSFAMSLILLYANLGPVPGFIGIWLSSFATAFAVSIPISLIAQPVTDRLLRRLFEVQE